MNILGISAFYHDSACCLVRDGNIVAAAQEERFTRKKHDSGFPSHAVEYCLSEGGVSASDIDFVSFYDKPLLKFERILETYLAFAPKGLRFFLSSMPVWLRQKLHIQRELDRGLKNGYQGRYIFPEHHESHAASAFFPSPFREAAIAAVDGVGEWTTTSLGAGRGNRIELTHELRFPHSLGLLYGAFTYFAGFRVNSGENKLMGLAPYGEPRFKKAIMDNMLDLKEDGSFRMDMSYFNYCHGLTMTSSKMEKLLEGPPRKPETEISRREMDIAASIQAVAEEIMLHIVRFLARETKMSNLVLAGGAALNCVANGKIMKEGIFDNIWVQPAAGDAGAALGAALFVWHQLLGKERKVDGKNDLQKGSLLGPEFKNDEIKTFLDSVGAEYTFFDHEDELLDAVADCLSDGNVVGHFHGRMEFGPRALGNRSILGDPRSENMQATINSKIKFRESFRPFAPSVLEDAASEWFNLDSGMESPYMLFAVGVKESKRLEVKDCSPDLNLFERLRMKRSAIPAATHVDYSARVQTVDSKRNGRYFRLIKKFLEKTGCPAIVNTSFNVRGEPIVCSHKHAYECFMACDMDILVLENFLLKKQGQPGRARRETADYISRFELD